MLDLMIDIEGLDIIPSATILTIGAQLFDPFGEGIPESEEGTLYCRLNTESQEGRTISDSTIEWWSSQPQEAQDEALNEEGRIDLRDALERLSKIVNRANHIWANGPVYDITILADAYGSLGMTTPWLYHKVRDCRTVYSLAKDLKMPPTSHNALDDCWRQIALLQVALASLNVTEIY